MAHAGRRKLSRRQRKRAGLGRGRSRPTSDEAIARALRQAPESDRATGDASSSPPEAPPTASAESQALGDLSYVPADMRRIAILAVIMFVLLAVVAAVLGAGSQWISF